MLRGADRGCEHLGRVAVVAVHLHDLRHQGDAIAGDVVESADEGRDVRGASLGGQQCLPGREDEGAVGADALRGEVADGLDAVGDAGHFDNDVRVEVGQHLTFVHHALEVGRDHFGAHVATNNAADLHVMVADVLLTADAFLGHQ